MFKTPLWVLWPVLDSDIWPDYRYKCVKMGQCDQSVRDPLAIWSAWLRNSSSRIFEFTPGPMNEWLNAKILLFWPILKRITRYKYFYRKIIDFILKYLLFLFLCRKIKKNYRIRLKNKFLPHFFVNLNLNLNLHESTIWCFFLSLFRYSEKKNSIFNV